MSTVSKTGAKAVAASAKSGTERKVIKAVSKSMRKLLAKNEAKAKSRELRRAA